MELMYSSPQGGDSVNRASRILSETAGSIIISMYLKKSITT